VGSQDIDIFKTTPGALINHRSQTFVYLLQ
jgi:hypothetical protein